MTVSALRLLPAEDVGPDEILSAIEEAFGRPRGDDWFAWKHLDGPWGPSRGLVAVDDLGVAGVRLLLPWRVRFGEEEIIALRAVEAASVPRAQGRGIFKMLNTALMKRVASEDERTFLFSTPNQLSRGGYRKLGWAPLAPVAHGYHLPLRRAAATENVTLDEALEDLPEGAVDRGRPRIATAWTSTALRWRIDPRTGNRYSASRLRHGSEPNGLLYRILSKRRIRILSVVHTWGARSDLRALIGGTARRERAPIVLAPVGSGADAIPLRSALHRGRSLLMVWSASGTGNGWPVMQTEEWSLSMADLESVL